MHEPLRRVNRPRSVAKPTVPIVRCDATCRYTLNSIVLSDDVYGVETHYAGRTIPCPGLDAGCRYCEAERAVRWVGYVAATDPVSRTKCYLLELTAGVMGDVDAWFKANGTLRALYFQLTRPSSRPTGRLEVLIQRPTGVHPADLPEAFDVGAALFRIWKGSMSGEELNEAQHPIAESSEERPGAIPTVPGNHRRLAGKFPANGRPS